MIDITVTGTAEEVRSELTKLLGIKDEPVSGVAVADTWVPQDTEEHKPAKRARKSPAKKAVESYEKQTPAEPKAPAKKAPAKKETEKNAQVITHEVLQKKLTEAVKAGRRADVKAALASVGAAKVSEVQEDDYEKVVQFLAKEA